MEILAFNGGKLVEVEVDTYCFPIGVFLNEIKKRINSWKPPVLVFAGKVGYSPFKILISTILSLRTKDEITGPASDRLFELAETPEMILTLSSDRIQQAIYPVGFYRLKTDRIIQISRVILEKYDGYVPGDMETLLTLPGVGRKTANLVLSEGFNILSICVDTHVHRISNRIGYVKTDHPNKTEIVLRNKLPKKYWKCYNRLLVGFGQVICGPTSPLCTKCPVSFICHRVGIKNFR